jgi:hypothetical protein
MAVQLWLGILSIRRARPHLAHLAHLGADGTNLAMAARRKLPHRGEYKRGTAKCRRGEAPFGPQLLLPRFSGWLRQAGAGTGVQCLSSKKEFCEND